MAQIHALTPEGRLPSAAIGHVEELVVGKVDTDDPRLPALEPRDAALVSITDSTGRSTWLEANDVDGGPTEWAAEHIRAVIDSPVEWQEVELGTGRGLWSEGPGGLQRITSDPSVIACWGDSLTDGDPQPYITRETAWPAILDADYAGGTTFNAGLGGLCSDEIAFRQGGYVITVDATTIPASGSVDLTIQNVIRWRLGSWNFPVTLAGVEGTFSRAGGVSTFTRATAGDPVSVPSGEPIRSIWGAQYADNVQVIFAGRNDIAQDQSNPAGSPVDRTVAATVAMVERLTPKHPRVLLVGTTTATNEVAGTAGYQQVQDINETLRAMYPDSFYDLRAYLAHQCIHDLGITPTAEDQTAMEGDTLPPSIMVPGDRIHFDAPAHTQVGHRIYEQLTQRGWIPA